ncbi:MAG: CocE/NonD family hydrolase [Gammaproteobacteria bacterium]|nr:CocE/NonD family hydrolase [Gammaproteobacteria bacterium]MYD75264.1 CocE/NonD family hydrolase [Gammaproteobacteria bacterium]MYJ51369.1 CocE/NonD family hydrolase [Gammaproteobacteria bacterium]
MTSDIPIRTDFPRKVREIENTWIPMPDGTRLAARIWLPEDAVDDPVPAILEYLPYRKRDGTVERDHLTHPYFAGFGYAGVRVDMRGTGDSEGVCRGEYLLQEQEDCLAVIEWLAVQPWCSGKVGMIGISWGGFNGLQVAARRPEALGAVISLCSTDDRYADDIHFMGGAVLAEKLAWGATAFAIAHTPPDPAIVGDRWREMWLERLEGNGLWLVDWFRHQHRNEFYAHGSICENYADVDVPVYLVGGWADGYTNVVLRMLEHLSCPRKGLIGPWGHKYPHFAVPGPRIGFLQECLRWWDQHLKGIDTGIMDEPPLRAWIQHPVPPSPFFETRPGHWTTAPGWTGAAAATKTLFPADGMLAEEPGEPVILSTPQNAGYTAGNWCGYSVVPDGPVDQNEEAAMVCFDTAPLNHDLDLLGFPVLTARIASNVPQANLIAVLSDVQEDGKATRISYGILNLTHRNSHAEPEPMPGEPVPVRFRLNACGQRIAKGHRLRLALSTAYWPVVWPSQSRASLTLAGTRVDLPVWQGDVAPDDFQNPEGATPLASEVLSDGAYERCRSIDMVTGVETCEVLNDSGLERHVHTGIETRSISRERFSIHPDNPNSAVGVCSWVKHYARGDWSANLDVSVTVRALETDWQIDARLRAVDGEGVVAEKSWSETVSRNLV